MRRSVPLLVFLGAAACGAPLNVSYRGESPQPINLTMKCVAAAADSLGYKPLLVNGGKGVEATRRDSVNAAYEDGRVEKISASGANAKGNDGGSTLVVTGATYTAHWTRVGLETTQIPVSERVKGDALKVYQRCGGGS